MLISQSVSEKNILYEFFFLVLCDTVRYRQQIYCYEQLHEKSLGAFRYCKECTDCGILIVLFNRIYSIFYVY